MAKNTKSNFAADPEIGAGGYRTGTAQELVAREFINGGPNKTAIMRKVRAEHPEIKQPSVVVSKTFSEMLAKGYHAHEWFQMSMREDHGGPVGNINKLRASTELDHLYDGVADIANCAEALAATLDRVALIVSDPDVLPVTASTGKAVKAQPVRRTTPLVRRKPRG